MMIGQLGREKIYLIGSSNSWWLCYTKHNDNTLIKLSIADRNLLAVSHVPSCQEESIYLRPTFKVKKISEGSELHPVPILRRNFMTTLSYDKH